MNTRNNRNYIDGYYRALNDPGYQKNIKLQCLTAKSSTNIPKSYRKFIDKINEEILKKLKFSTNNSPICVCRIKIGINIYNYLKENFDIKGRFQEKSNFTNSISIKQKRYFALNKFCDFDVKTFEIKISKRRAFKCFEEGMVKLQIPQDSVFTFRFVRRNNVARANT